jgi:hypothetical protein
MALDYTVDVRVSRPFQYPVLISVRRILDESGNYAFVTKSIDGNGKHTSITPQERAEAVRRVKSGEGMPGRFR